VSALAEGVTDHVRAAATTSGSRDNLKKKLTLLRRSPDQRAYRRHPDRVAESHDQKC
jgi:hypothetical protein